MDTTENNSTQVTQTQESATHQVFDTQAQSPESETPKSWMWGEDIAGEGDKPEWFKDSKYKSVSEQAKAYTELEKRLGGFIGAPAEGYQLAEDFSDLSSDPSIKAVLDVLGEHQASNEFANKLIETYINAQQEQAQAQIANEMKLLGENADYRIKAIQDFSASAIPSHLQDTFKAMVSTAGSVEVIEALMAKAQGSKVAPESSTTSNKMDSTKLREMMMAVDDNGNLKASIDPEYRRKVDAMYKEFYGG